jgi:RNA polymerase sigma factor (sigma-70 family)
MSLRVKSPRPRLAELLSDPTLLASLARFVGARLPQGEVDDVVQSVVAEAMVSQHAPSEEGEVRPWVHGIARHKVVDWYRANRREVPQDPELQDAIGVDDNAAEASDLYRWAQRELPEGEEHAKTLEWMLREGAGEKLEAIAADENVPAPRVRQRVSRLRRHYKARWAAQAAAVAALLVLVVVIVILRSRKEEEIAPRPAPSAVPSLLPEPTLAPPEPTPDERAAELRRDALQKCDAKAWQECLDGLDAARALDPAGDGDPKVRAARDVASKALLQKQMKSAPPKDSTAPFSMKAPSPFTTNAAPPPLSTATTPAPVAKPSPKKGPSKAGPSFSSFGSDGSNSGSLPK